MTRHGLSFRHLTPFKFFFFFEFRQLVLKIIGFRICHPYFSCHLVMVSIKSTQYLGMFLLSVIQRYHKLCNISMHPRDAGNRGALARSMLEHISHLH